MCIFVKKDLLILDKQVFTTLKKKGNLPFQDRYVKKNECAWELGDIFLALYGQKLNSFRTHFLTLQHY